MSVRRTSLVVVLAILALAAVLVLSNGVLPAAAAPAKQAGTATPASTATTVATATAANTAITPRAQSAATPTGPRTITVVGRGEVKVRPDVANTTLGVEALGATVDAAMADAQARMTSILDALNEIGIQNKDIQTSNFSINFERQGEPRPVPAAQATPGAFEPPAGFYRVSNMVQVTIRDLDTVGDVIDTAVRAGANNVWGISFNLEDTDALETQAREEAVKDARARAESLALLTGVEAGGVVSISEVIGNQAIPMFDAAMGRGGGGSPIEPGEVSFTMQIQVVYAIE